MRAIRTITASALVLSGAAGLSQQVPYPTPDYAPAQAAPYGQGPSSPYGGYLPGGYPPAGNYPPAGYPQSGGYPPGGYPPAGYPGGGGYPPGGYPPPGYPPAGYPPGGGYGPSGPLDLEAPPFGMPVTPPVNDPAFGPLPARPPAALTPVAPLATGPFTPDIPVHRPLSVRDFGWTYIEPPVSREIALHDIITILVDEKSELMVQSRFNRQRNSSFKAELKEFLRIDDDGNLATAAGEGASIDANLRGRMQSDGSVADREGIRYRIAATVVGVLPNGNVVLEARKTISSNDGVWEYTLTGTIASRDIKADYTAISETIANLQIEKHQKGKIADSTQRPWGMWLYDKLSPF